MWPDLSKIIYGTAGSQLKWKLKHAQLPFVNETIIKANKELTVGSGILQLWLSTFPFVAFTPINAAAQQWEILQGEHFFGFGSLCRLPYLIWPLLCVLALPAGLINLSPRQASSIVFVVQHSHAHSLRSTSKQFNPAAARDPGRQVRIIEIHCQIA